MTRPRLIIAIRCAVLALACLFFIPCWLWWVPFALMMPAFASCTQTCTRCDSNVSACNYQIDIAGVTDQSCGTCSTWNTSYVMAFNSTCAFISSNFTACGSTRTLTLNVAIDGPDIFNPTRQYKIEVTTVIGGNSAGWRKSLTTTPPACVSYSGEVLTLVVDTDTTCDFTSSTATVTAL